MIAFSFVIPHKNSPGLLKTCLDSIPRRDDVQIIVVDDNSNDEAVDFNNFPGADDHAVEVYLTKEGRGAGYARNVGLSHARGKWVVFADADDFFTAGLEQAMDDFVDADFDVVFFKNESIMIPSGKSSYRGYELNRRVDIALSSGDTSLAMLYSSPWQKFFRRDLLEANGIRFNEVRWGNDVVFMGRVAACAGSVAVSDRVVYCLTESDSSIVKDPSLESRLVRFVQECENVEILKNTKYKAEPSLYYWHFRTWFDVWKMSRDKAFKLLPKAIHTSGIKFIKEALAAKFSK